MKFYQACAGLILGCAAIQPVAAQKIKTFEDSVAYSIGLDIAKNLQKTGYTFDPEMIALGMKDLTKEPEKKQIKEEAVMGIMMRFQMLMQKKQQEEQMKAAEAKKGEAEKNRAEAEAFLAANKTKPNVKTTPSGLQYEIVASTGDPNGKHPTLQDNVTVHYEGKLLNGKIFDSSYERKEPISFPLNGLIEAWKEGIQLMKPGDTFMLYVPPALGYGEGGAGEDIGPNSLLIFKVELLSIGGK